MTENETLFGEMSKEEEKAIAEYVAKIAKAVEEDLKAFVLPTD